MDSLRKIEVKKYQAPRWLIYFGYALFLTVIWALVAFLRTL